MLNTPQVATKGEFAAMIGVSPGRVSQYIAEGKLTARELQGHGRAAKVRVSEALEALNLKLDMSQMTGNGAATRLQPDAPPTDGVEIRFKQAKLDAQLAVNRRLEEEENLRKGIYMLTDEARAEMARMASQILQGFEGGLADMAAAVAAEHKLPQRDVLHQLRAQFRALREKISERLASAGHEMPTFIAAAEVPDP